MSPSAAPASECRPGEIQTPLLVAAPGIDCILHQCVWHFIQNCFFVPQSAICLQRPESQSHCINTPEDTAPGIDRILHQCVWHCIQAAFLCIGLRCVRRCQRASPIEAAHQKIHDQASNVSCTSACGTASRPAFLCLVGDMPSYAREPVPWTQHTRKYMTRHRVYLAPVRMALHPELLFCAPVGDMPAEAIEPVPLYQHTRNYSIMHRPYASPVRMALHPGCFYVLRSAVRPYRPESQFHRSITPENT